MASSHKPRIACELTPERVIAAHAESGTIDVVSARTLPAGSLAPGLGATNIPGGTTVREAVTDALAVVGGRSREVIAIVPDAAVRIVLLDFEDIPERKQDADSVIRFRLKKSLPFDADQAALSYDVRRSNGAVKVVAAVAPSAVLEEYETLFRDAGYNPGVVLPSMLAALGAVQAAQPTLVLKVDVNTTSVAIVQAEDLLLYRTLENAHGHRIEASSLADDIYPSLVFFQDNYGIQVERILLGGLADSDDIGSALESHTGAHVSDLVSAAQAGPADNVAPSQLAAVVGALAG